MYLCFCLHNLFTASCPDQNHLKDQSQCVCVYVDGMKNHSACLNGNINLHGDVSRCTAGDPCQQENDKMKIELEEEMTSFVYPHN